ncbi:hypothetical protein A1359_20060 [Methylomonas lenta]|uniref:Diguanylate cyclase n=1 Tax=Methylomonas lenta TaxID=980561 RepID=A0A177NSF1_9GAMM|nr:diguanylate cyclase [Methylomonas lenta]OAI20895.1 hypothetical protein A1359_20060 [Methylomonas lenta]
MSSINSLSFKRRDSYLLLALGLIATSYALQDINWEGSVSLHTLMESLATLLAFFVGGLALIRYFSQGDRQFLYVGAGFIGTGFLDAYHAVVTSAFFLPYMPSTYPHLVPWSWIASRLFLSLMLFISWLLDYRYHNQPMSARHSTTVLWLTALATMCCFLFFALVPLPDASNANWPIPRPYDLVPAAMFLLALIGYLRKGLWRENDFEHWLVLSLIVGFATQSVFMPFSTHVNDTEFNLAHLLKKISYLLVLIGLSVSLYQTYAALKRETERRLAVENELRIEAEVLARNERWFKTIADYTYDWETWFSPQGEVLYSSPACERITGFPTLAFQTGALTMESILSPKERVDIARHFQQIDDRGPEELEFRIITKSGEERWINHICHPVYDETGCFVGRRGSNRDITQRKLADLENMALRAAIRKAPAAVVITNAAGTIEYVNPKFEEITGYAKQEVLGKNPRVLKSNEHPKEFYEHLWATLISGHTWTGEIYNKRKDGGLFWEHAAISPIMDEEGNIWKYVAVKQDVTESKKQAEMLYQQANYDILTKLPNRSCFNDRFQLAFKKISRVNKGLALMMLDLDYFKAVNDNLGHDAGDILLKQAAERMLNCVRETDAVGRIGGDEFMVLIEGYEDTTIAEEIAQRLVDELAKPFRVLNQSCVISASIGLAFFHAGINSAEALQKNADIALYQAKNKGRNGWVLFTNQL